MAEVREGYQRVAALHDVPDGGCLAAEVAGKPVVLVRRGRQVTALDNCCPHAGAPLSEGFVEGNLLTCAWHGFTFDVDSGLSSDGAGFCVPRHDVVVEGDDVLVRA